MTFTLNLQSSPSTDIKFISSTNVLFNFPAIIATNSLSSGNESLRVSGVISSNYVTGSEHG